MTVVTICCDNWSGLPFPVPEDIPGPGIERMSLAWQANSLPLASLGKQIYGGEMETVADFIFLGSKSTADGDFNDEIKRCLLLGRKAMIDLDSILKSRNITLLTKVKAMFFPVVWYGCESWTIKKTEHQRTDVFEL